MPITREDLAIIFAVPLADPETVNRLAELSIAKASSDLATWAEDLQRMDDRFRVEATPLLDGAVKMSFSAPISGEVIAVLLGEDRPDAELAARFSKALDANQAAVVLRTSGSESDEELLRELGIKWEIDRTLVLTPEWTAAILVEGLRPDFLGVGDHGTDGAVAGYVQVNSNDGATIGVRRSSAAATAVSIQYTNTSSAIADHVRAARHLATPYDGTVLLASTYLPPVTHSLSAVLRFYSRDAISTERVQHLVRERYEAERETWVRHIESFKRIDVIDRRELMAYFRSPDYHRMHLSKSELIEQVENLLELLRFENYSLCLTPEPIDLSFEIRGSEVRIRADRRNKGEPRAGRITSLALDNASLAEVMEEEFWSLRRLTEDRFKDKDSVVAWIESKRDGWRRAA